ALVLTGAILVFSFIGLIWSTSAGDLARHQKPAGAGAVSMLIASFGNALPAFTLIVYGALLAASDPVIGSGFADDPIVALSKVVPSGLLIPLVVSVGIGLLSGVILSIYTLGFTVAAIAPLRRDLAVLLGGVTLGVVAIVFALVAIDLTDIFRDLTTTIAVPIAAWLGVFAADVMIRNRRFDTRSLVQRGGVYPDVNWVNLAILVLAGAVGYGFTTASASWLAWQGYLLELVAVAPDSELGGSDLGVLVALGQALVAALSASLPAARRQEAKSNRRLRAGHRRLHRLGRLSQCPQPSQKSMPSSNGCGRAAAPKPGTHPESWWVSLTHPSVPFTSQLTRLRSRSTKPSSWAPTSSWFTTHCCCAGSPLSQKTATRAP